MGAWLNIPSAPQSSAFPLGPKLLASAWNTRSTLSNKAQRGGLFTPAAYTSVDCCFFFFAWKFEGNSRIALLSSRELGNFGNSKLRHVNQVAFNRIGFQHGPRMSRPSGAGGPIRRECRVQKDGAHPSMIDARRWTW